MCKLAKNAKLSNREEFEIGGQKLIAHTFETYNSWGHIIENDYDYIAKICYLNRTWESYTYQDVLRKACEELGLQKEFNEYDDKRCGREHEECEKFIKSFENLYNQTSDTLKEKLKNVTIENEEQAKGIQTLMAFDVLLNKI